MRGDDRSEMPLVTVVTPSYNYGRYIADCLESVRTQTYPAIEHLVLDSCSDDQTSDVVESFLGTYRLRGIFEKDAGQADALNRGFALAQGEIYCWLNADDYWLHDRVVEQAVAALADCDLVAGEGCYVDDEGGRLLAIRLDPKRAIAEMENYSTLLQPATFWRKRVHVPLRTDLHYVFDWRLFLDIKAGSGKAKVVEEEWAAFRWHEASKTAVDPALRRREIADVLQQQWGSLSAHHLWARVISGCYRFAEKTHIPYLKWAVQKVNRGIRYLMRLGSSDSPATLPAERSERKRPSS